MPHIGSRLLLASGALLTAGALTLAAPAAGAVGAPHAGSSHSAAAHHIRRQLVDVPMSDHGFHLPRVLHAGLVTFRATSHDGNHMLLGMMLRRGVGVRRINRDFWMAVSRNHARAAAGMRRVFHDAVLVGGPAVDRFGPVSSTMALGPGTYYFVDFDAYLKHRHPVYRRVCVRGRGYRDGRFDRRRQVIAQVDTPRGPRFLSPPVLDPDRGILVVNRSHGIHEAVFKHLRRRANDGMLGGYYDAQAINHRPPFNPFDKDAERGAAPQSPGRWQVVRFQARHARRGRYAGHGRYALLCLVPDWRTGVPYAFEGMRRIVRLR